MILTSVCFINDGKSISYLLIELKVSIVIHLRKRVLLSLRLNQCVHILNRVCLNKEQSHNGLSDNINVNILLNPFCTLPDRDT